MTARKAPEVAKPAEAEVTVPPTPEVAKPAGDDHLAIALKVAIAGTHDGHPWPARGGTAILPRVDAEEYLRLGYAEPVD